MDLPLIPLDRSTATTQGGIGGKAAPLARLARAGVPVPAGFVLPADAMGIVIDRAGLAGLSHRVWTTGDPEAAERLHAALAAVPLPPGWEARLRAAVATLGGRVAVRSSALDEDGAAHSFAGQHHTALDVDAAGVADAVRRCWASLVSPGAMAYRRGSGPAPASMAILVQRMLRPRTAGVLFTVDPVSGSWREMVVEAVWGVAEPLVSGRVAPHWYRVRRPRSLPRGLNRLARRVRLRRVEASLPPLPGGPPGPTLSEPELLRLCRLGLKVERRFGCPQDIEWAQLPDGRFLVLQARPITTRPGPPATTVLWTRRFVGERWPEPATPLGWSLLHPILDHFIAYPDVQARLLGGGPALRLVRGRPYVNATVFRHLAFKLPGSPPPAFILDLLPPEEAAVWRRRSAATPDPAVYAAILRTTWRERRWERFAWNPLTNGRAWDRYQARLAAALPGLAVPPSDVADALARVDAHLALVREYIGVHVCSLLFAALAYQLLDGALGAWLPTDAPRLMDALATCPPGNHTLETNAALWTLANTLTDDELAALADGRAVDSPALARFLERYGHRSAASWEIMAPRWRDSPADLVPVLRLQRRATDPPRVAADDAEQAAAAARAEIDATLTGSAHALTSLLVHHTRRYLLLRENQRFWFDRLLDSLQRVLRWLGAALVARGGLDTADDVAWLTWAEVRGALDGEHDLRALADQRRQAHEADRQVLPPAFLAGDEDDAPPPDAPRLQGLGVGPGRARGPVRVVRSPADAEKLQPGDVIVARSVDPGWTPLFPQAAALVLELGSALSHGAVVAREYGLPAVANLDRVTDRLRDGTSVTVDGTRGTVFVHN